MSNKREDMLAFWSSRVQQYGTDPRANTNDVWLRELEIQFVDRVIATHGGADVLDFGCANGYTTVQVAKRHPGCRFVGVDINAQMIAAAEQLAAASGCANVSFRTVNVMDTELAERFDVVFAVRALQNVESASAQRRVIDALDALMRPGAVFAFIESYADGYAQLNADRARMNLPLLPIHPHLTLLTEDLDRYVEQRMQLLERASPSSTYYLVTRLLYSFIANMKGEPIDYNHVIHQVAVLLPQVGEYGPQRARVFRK